MAVKINDIDGQNKKDPSTNKDDAFDVTSDSNAGEAPVNIIHLKFSNVKKGSRASITIAPESLALWSEGFSRQQFLGIKFSAEDGGVMNVKNLSLNDRELSFIATENATNITVNLFVQTHSKLLRGRVELPPGATVMIESVYDRSTLLGLSSFAVELKPF